MHMHEGWLGSHRLLTVNGGADTAGGSAPPSLNASIAKQVDKYLGAESWSFDLAYLLRLATTTNTVTAPYLVLGGSDP